MVRFRAKVEPMTNEELVERIDAVRSSMRHLGLVLREVAAEETAAATRRQSMSTFNTRNPAAELMADLAPSDLHQRIARAVMRRDAAQ